MKYLSLAPNNRAPQVRLIWIPGKYRLTYMISGVLCETKNHFTGNVNGGANSISTGNMLAPY